ncbi:MAG: DEAD/DEAH box helicase, partial [Anaerolineae bacterium]
MLCPAAKDYSTKQRKRETKNVRRNTQYVPHFAYPHRPSIIPAMASTVAEALQELRLNPRFAAQITAWQCLPARSGRFAPLPEGLEPQLQEALRRLGIQSFYTHQSQAIAAALHGEDVAVVTGAASGKTLCYNIPVLNTLLRDPQARALYLFPTKALAQDQLAAWQNLSQDLLPSEAAATYDGDTPSPVRARIREGTRVLITNPDMLHVGILPHHTRWAAFFAGLK